MSNVSQLKRLEVLNLCKGEWMALAEASEKVTLKKTGNKVTATFDHEGKTVVTVYHLDQFAAYTLV